MAVDRAPVILGEAAPGYEPHRARLVEQQNGGAIAAQRPDDRIERRLVDLGQRPGMLQPFGEFVERLLLRCSARERLLRLLAIGDVMLDANGVEKAPLRIAHRRGGNRGPEVSTVFSPDALFDAVSVDVAGNLAFKLRIIALD